MSRAFDILVIEDERVVGEGARRVLAPEGLTLDRAVDAETALAKLEECSYRLLLCDLMLPGATGFDFVARLCREHPATPVVVITGYARAENAVGALAAGAFDYLPKPFAVEELLAVVRRALAYRAERGPPEAAGEAPLYRLGDHSWARLEADGSARLGLGDTFRPLPELTELELLSPGEAVIQGQAFARLIDRDGCLHQVWSPLSGHVLEGRSDSSALRDSIRTDRLGAGWLVRISPDALKEEIKRLVPAAARRGS